MPGRDGTGPIGRGAMTGRGLGRCNVTSDAVPVRGLGLGLGRGRRFGRGTPSAASDTAYDKARTEKKQEN